ncbi:MAG: WD40 repeat domain-containing protein [Pirellulales bacterium]|nr:WD40 repeat domain-containing protein [Pirellulales bacterium]
MSAKLLPLVHPVTLVLVAASYVPHSQTVLGQVPATERRVQPVNLSGLRHESIPLYERKIAGDGEAANAPASLVSLIGDSRLNHWETVTAVEFSPEAQLLASSSTDGTVRFWDLAKGEEVRRFTMTPRWLNGPNALSDIAISPDGRLLAAACDRVGVVMWSVESGKELRLLRTSQDNLVGSVVFHPTRPIIASTHDGEARLWNVETGDEIHRLRSHSGTFRRVSSRDHVLVEFATNGEMLVMGHPDGSIQFWSIDSGMQIKVLDKHVGKASERVAVSSLVVSDDGTLLAAGYADGAAKVWRIADGELLLSKEHAHQRDVQAVRFHPAKMVLASGGLDGRIRYWNLESGELTLDIEASRFSGVESLSFEPQGDVLASGGLGVRLWDSNSGEPHIRGSGHTGGIASFDISSDGATITTGGDDGLVIQWDTLSGQSQGVLDVGRASLPGLDLSSDGRRLVTLEFGGLVKLWNLEANTIEKSWRISPYSDFAHMIAMSANERLIAASGRFGPRGETVLIDVQSDVVYDNTQIESCWVLGFSPDGEELITAGRSIDVWNTPDLKRRVATGRVVEGSDRRAAAISTDGRTIAVSGSTLKSKLPTNQRHKHAIVLWHAGKQEVRSVVDLGSRPAHMMAFSLDSTKLAVVCGDENVLRVLHVDGGKLGDEMKIAPPGPFVVRGIRFMPDGQHLAIAMGNGTVCIHNVSGSR